MEKRTQFVAKARYVRCSPSKLRPLAAVIRGKNVDYALNWLATCALERAVPLRKTVQSAAANAKNLDNLETQGLRVKEIRIDQGPTVRYFKPGAMGRANPQRKRFSHVSVVLESTIKQED